MTYYVCIFTVNTLGAELSNFFVPTCCIFLSRDTTSQLMDRRSETQIQRTDHVHFIVHFSNV